MVKITVMDAKDSVVAPQGISCRQEKVNHENTTVEETGRSVDCVSRLSWQASACRT